jgi:ATP/maltotriose-dependent transcriptional regulator MalT
MPPDTISVTTYADPETIKVPEAPDGGKSAISIVPGWGDKSQVARELLSETRGLVRRDIPVETIERELQKLIGVMDRVFSDAEQAMENKSNAESAVPGATDKKKLQLTEVSLAVEITGEGTLSRIAKNRGAS